MLKTTSWASEFHVWLESSFRVEDAFQLCLKPVASRPRFGGDSQALSWVGTSWKGSAGQGPVIPDEIGTRLKGFSYVYKYQLVIRVE
jgi:hypothetical protein